MVPQEGALVTEYNLEGGTEGIWGGRASQLRAIESLYVKSDAVYI